VNFQQLKRVVDEASGPVAGSRVQKIHHPEEGCLQIGVYAGGARKFITLRTAPGLISFYLAESRTVRPGEAASGFCMKLRAHLEGALLDRIELAGDDRIINFFFVGRDSEKLRLVAELFGVRANCYLLADDGRILAVMNSRPAGGRQNREGAQYTPPPPPKGPPPAQGDDPLEIIRRERELGSYNQAAEAYYEALAEKGGIESLRSRVLRELTGEKKRLEKLADQHDETLAGEPQARWFSECGEILSANFHNIRKGLSVARLPDFYAESPGALREIPLEESLPPQTNIERYFKKARKIKSGARYARAHLVEVRRQLAELDSLIERVAAAASPEQVLEVADEAGIELHPGEKKKKGGGKAVEPRLPYRRFRARDGSLILVGRGPSENDELTFHVANGRDLWLHVAGATGSHVVLSCQHEGGYSEEALLDAAHLAAFFSGLRSEPAADVDYTLRKNVSKPPGLPPGRAVIASRRTLHLRIDRERLDRLLGRRPDFQT